MRAFYSRVACFALGCLAVPAALGQGGTWSALPHPPPWAPSTMFLLTDGSILCQRDYPNGTQWAKLVPDINGNYLNGTWVTVASSTYTRLYYACGVLADGRVVVSGGEYSNAGSETTKTEVYDPVANSWVEIAAPSGWTQVGDAPSMVTADGRFLMGSIQSNRTAFLDPVTLTWTAGPLKLNSRCSEESWCLLQDNTILSTDCFGHPAAEKWVPGTNSWVTTGNMVPDPVLPSSLEIGGAINLPDGRCLVVGGTPHTTLYSLPPTPSAAGTWTAGPDFPLINARSVGAEDAPCCLMPNGRVLITVSPVTANGGSYESPCYCFEFDGTNLNRLSDPPNNNGPAYNGRFMVLPTGQVLVAQNGSIQVFTPNGSPDPSWRPTITSCPGVVAPNGTYALQGRQLNGLSICVAYGDEANTATNYPLVRIRNLATNHVFYCRTFNHSTMGIATGTAIVATNFQVPAGIESGQSELSVVVNGIASDSLNPQTVYVSTTAPVNPTGYSIFRGQLVSGALADTLVSDNLYLQVRPGPVLNSGEASIQVIFDGTSPTTSPVTLQLKVESSCTVTNVGQTVMLWNYQTNQWESVHSRSLATNDVTIYADAGGDLSRFVHQKTRAMRAKLWCPAQGPVLSYPYNVKLDQVIWIVGT